MDYSTSQFLWCILRSWAKQFLAFWLCFLFLVNVTEFLPRCRAIDAPQRTAVTESEAFCISSWSHACRSQWHRESASDLLWAGDGAEVLDLMISWGISRRPADCPKACQDKWFIIKQRDVRKLAQVCKLTPYKIKKWFHSLVTRQRHKG